MGWVFYLSVLWGAWGTVPGRDALKEIRLPAASEVYDRDGVLMGKYFIEERTQVNFTQISPHAISALIATEDIRFYQHSGVDLWSLMRVVWKSLILGDKSAGGGSTLSQQLAKNLFSRKDYGSLSLPVNKVRETIIARRLERLYTKDQLLALYYNTVAFGENAFGIASASRRFFSTRPDSLQVHEAALLVGMLKAPSAYNPRNHPETAKRRRNLVLDQMVKYDFLPASQADSLKGLPLDLRYTLTSHHDGIAPYFRAYLRQFLHEWLKKQSHPDGRPVNLYTDGLKIYTTLDATLQEYATQAVKHHLTSLQASFNRQVKPLGSKHPAVRAALGRTPHYRAWEAQGLPDSKIDSLIRVPGSMTLFDWKGPQQVEGSMLDSLAHYERLLRAGFIALDPRNGAVRAWVGGPDHHFIQFDHVTARRQTGSIFKPLVFATALEQGMDPCQYFSNDRTVYERYDNWTPRNADEMYGGEYSMQGALTYSVNLATIHAIMEVGPSQVVKTAQELGISGHLPAVPSLALGTADVSLQEIAHAYAALINGGKYFPPLLLTRVKDRYGNTIWETDAKHQAGKKVLSPQTAETMVELLQSVVKLGTGRSLLTRFKLSEEIAGKTGTSQDQADGWFVGATPELLAAVWVGTDDRRVHFPRLIDGQGSRTALPVYGNFMQGVYQNPRYASIKETPFSTPSPTVIQSLACDPYSFMVSMSTFKKWWEEQVQASEEGAANLPILDELVE